MKRAISLVLVFTLIFTLVGCSRNKDDSSITEVKVKNPCSTGSRAIVEGETELIGKMTGTYDAKSMTATFEPNQAKVIVIS